MNSVLEVIDIKKTFPKHPIGNVLDGISLKIVSGTSTAVVGSSGNGKSTLLQIMGCLDEPDYGRLLFKGREISRKQKALIRNCHFGFIFQNFHLIEDETVLKNVLIPAIINRQNVSKNSALFFKAVNLLNYVGIPPGMHDFPAQFLSGGEKQRVAIARALINDPSVIFADEPSGNLDRGNSKTIYDLLFDFVSKGSALIMVTHDLEVADLCNTKFVLKDGKLV